MKTLFFILAMAATNESAMAFDYRFIFDCDGTKVEVFDNLSNGKPVIASTFALVTPRGANHSYVLKEKEFSFTVGDVKNFFEDQRNHHSWDNCPIISEQPLTDRAPR